MNETIPEYSKIKTLSFIAGAGLTLFGFFGALPVGIITEECLSSGRYSRNHPNVSQVLGLQCQTSQLELLCEERLIQEKERDNGLKIIDSRLKRIEETTPNLQHQITTYNKRKKYNDELSFLAGVGTFMFGIMGGGTLVHYSLSVKKKEENE